MKKKIKHQLSELGIFHWLDLIRRFPKIAGWICNGCTGVLPPPIKRLVLAYYLEQYSLSQFVETGTYMGDTLAYVARRKSVKCTSIELADIYFEAATQRFAAYTNVRLLHGDSGVLLPKVVDKMKTPALFWLDGHFSGGSTARGEWDTPVSFELRSILDSSVKDHVVLIDDAHCFDGTNSYPFIETIVNQVRDSGIYDIEVSADIIRLTPTKKVGKSHFTR